MPDSLKLSKYKEADFALFAAGWWPKADWDDYLLVTYMSIWLFVWDDEIDEDVGDSKLPSDFPASQTFRHETKKFVEHCLGFGQTEALPLASSPIINSFEDIAAPLRKAYTKGMSGTCHDCVHEFPSRHVPSLK